MILIKSPETESIVYPVIETSVYWREGGSLNEFYLPMCCFHDLIDTDEAELAGMGLAIIGNLCNYVQQGVIPMHADAKLELYLGPKAKPIDLPFPGMPNSSPLPLDLTALPFDYTMMHEDGKFRRLVDRQALMRVIESVWAPYITSIVSRDHVKRA